MNIANRIPKIELDKWKGKSSFSVIKCPDKFIVKTYQKNSKDESPEERITEITQEQINRLWLVIQSFNKNELKSREIAEVYYNTKWNSIFCDRPTHNFYTLMLRLMEFLGILEYKGSKGNNVKLLNKSLGVQLN